MNRPEVTFAALPDIVTGNPNIESMLDQMNSVYNESAQSRHKIQTKVMDAVDKMVLNTEGDPEQLEAQIRLLEQADRVISSREKAFTARITTKMKHQESDASIKAYSAITTKILSELDVNTIAPYVPTSGVELDIDALSRIESQLESLDKIEYNEGALRTDARDMS